MTGVGATEADDRSIQTDPSERALRILGVGSEQVASSPAVLAKLSQWAAEKGVHVASAIDLPRAVRMLTEHSVDLVFAVLGDRPLDELKWWVGTLRVSARPARLIALIEKPSIGIVLHAEQLGVTDLLSLPLRREDFERVLLRIQTANDEQAIPLPPVQPDLPGHAAMVGQHASMLEVYKLVARVAPNIATVLILGESGTGKEVVARAIHLNGPRASGPFIAVNCAAIPENLLESALFGHERGAFTGAVAQRAGRFELAVGGTLFLDEIAELSVVLQAKILRAVQEHEIERVGGGEVISVDVRVIAATNQDLRTAITEGRFRDDLYYRLAVVTIDLPRLIDRGEDLLLLTSFFATHFGRISGKNIRAISDRALDALRAHVWAGNVRELRNVVERAVIVTTDDTIRVEHLPSEFRNAEGLAPRHPVGAIPSLAEVEARHIRRALAHTGGVIGSAAALLGIHRNTLTKKNCRARPVNVEHALRVLPNVEGFLPLRALLLTSASANRLAPEASGSHRTVGKHELSADEVRERMPAALDMITGHFAVLSEAYVHALGCIERGTPAEAVDDLIRAGTTEAWGGRISEAREWFAVALCIAEGLRDRRPESAAMLALARLSMRTGNIEEAARCYRRSLELSEADGDIAAEIAACEGLGDIEVLRGLRPDGAWWYARALARARTTNDESRVALLRLALGKLWCAAGNLDAATEELRHARASFEDLEEIENLVRTLCVQAEVERDLDRAADSEATYREALAWSYRASDSCGIAIPVHIGIARLYLHTGRPLDAEAEIRRAEQLAGAMGRLGWLVQIYTFLGTLSGLREDPDGFVFFEQALGFSRTLRNSPVYEARICVEYAGYRYRMKEYAEARARLSSAHTFFTLVGAAGEASVVEAQLRLMGGDRNAGE